MWLAFILSTLCGWQRGLVVTDPSGDDPVGHRAVDGVAQFVVVVVVGLL